MTRQTLHRPVKTALGITVLLIVSTTLVGSPPEASSEAKKDKATPETGKKADEQARRAAEQWVREIEIEIRSADKWTKAERIDKPVLFFSDPTRHDNRGSVWAWGKKGRSIALLEIFHKLDPRPFWVFAICNTSGGKLRARRADAPWWLENDSAIEFKDIPSAPRVATDSNVRQRQLKLLAQKFTAHEIYNPKNTRYDLRRLERPLYTYRDERGGILEGGLFTFANGTNPEIMLFIEATVDRKGKSAPVWRYGVARSANAELHLEHDGKEVFMAPRGDRISGRNRPFWSSGLRSGLRETHGNPP